MSSKKNSSALSAEELEQVLCPLLDEYQNPKLILAYSGGVDSQTLLHLLAGLATNRKFSLRAIHVNHGLHSQADQWADFCKKTCDTLGVPLSIEKVNVMKSGHGLEAAAREARYQVLARYASSNEHIVLTAHHQDDQAETLLLHLVRGSGVSGLAAMPRQRQIGNGILCRPLLDTAREKILQYAQQHQLQWIEDDSNINPDVRRSFLRANIFPELREHWPNVSASMSRTARHMVEADKLLAEVAKLDMDISLNPAKNALLVSRLSLLSVERIRNLLRYRIRSFGMNMPSTRQLNQVEKLIQHPAATAHAEVRWGANWCRQYRDELWFGVVDASQDLTREFVWSPANTSFINLGCYRLIVNDTAGSGLSRQRAGSNLLIRYRRGGERCRLPGRAHRSTLKNLFQQAGVPPWDRETMPLIYVGDQLAAVGDRWVCEPFAAQADEPGWSLKLKKRPENQI